MYMMNFGDLQYACLSYCVHVHVLAELISGEVGGTSWNWLSSPLDLVISPPSLPVQQNPETNIDMGKVQCTYACACTCTCTCTFTCVYTSCTWMVGETCRNDGNVWSNESVCQQMHAAHMNNVTQLPKSTWFTSRNCSVIYCIPILVRVTLVYVCVCDVVTVRNSYYVSAYFSAYTMHLHPHS